MKIACATLLLTLSASLAGAGVSAPDHQHEAAALPVTEVATVAAKVKVRYEKGSKYMEGHDLGLVELPEWKGFPTRKWEYVQKDKDGTDRRATVIMLNPSPDQLARWVVRACYDLKNRYDETFCDTLLKHVFTCSGGQFVVRGICLEDMDGDGVHTAYPFRDGVTVKLRGIPGYPNHPLTDAESLIALNAPVSEVTQFAKRARLQSTQPAEWTDYTGAPPVDGPAWLDLVRVEYQKAWNSDSNAMLTATARALALPVAPQDKKGIRIQKLKAEISALLATLSPMCAVDRELFRKRLESLAESLKTETGASKVAELKDEQARIMDSLRKEQRAYDRLLALEVKVATLEGTLPPRRQGEARIEEPASD